MTDPIRTALAAIDGVVESDSRYKPDLAYWVNGTEIAHFETDSVLDVRLTRAVIRTHRDSLRADPAVTLRPVHPIGSRSTSASPALPEPCTWSPWRHQPTAPRPAPHRAHPAGLAAAARLTPWRSGQLQT